MYTDGKALEQCDSNKNTKVYLFDVEINLNIIKKKKLNWQKIKTKQMNNQNECD